MPFYLVPVRLARCLLFLLGFILFEFFCLVYQMALIAIPFALSRRQRDRHHHRRWNWIIAFWGRNTSRLARWTTGLTLEIQGRVPPGRHLVVANHQSAADIIVLFETLYPANLKFLVKKSLMRWFPVVSYALRNGGFGVVDFKRRQQTLLNMVGYAHELAEWDGSPLIFPEGIRSFDGSIGEFRTSGLRLLARETGLPILPVVIDGLWQARTALRFFVYLPGSRCRLSILPPVMPEDDSDRMVRGIESRMRDELDRMRADER